MKITSCHIDNFGKISDLTINFSDGINVINEPNAWGKSTLATFIKAMFYGFDTKKEAGAFDRERNIYRPWQGGSYGGELDFSVNGRDYRISRTFGKTEKNDEFHIYDLSTNLESVDYTEKVGEELFDLDGLSFKRSIYIAQNDCSAQTSDAINAKLGNLAENTNDINNYESAQEYLKNLANQLSPNRITGSIKKRKGQLAEIASELTSYESAEYGMSQLRMKQQMALAKKDQLNQTRDAYAMELQAASEESVRQEQQKMYLSLCEEQTKALEALVPFTDIFPNGLPDEDMLAKGSRAARSFEDMQGTLRHLEFTEDERERYGKLSAMFSNGTPADADIDIELEKLSNLSSVRDEHTKLLVKLSEREKECLQDAGMPLVKIPKIAGIAIFGIILALLGLAGELFCVFGLPKDFSYGVAVMVACLLVFVCGICFIVAGLQKKARLLKKQEEVRIAWEKEQDERNEVIEELQKQETDHNNKIWDSNQHTRMFLEQYQVFCGENDFSYHLYELKNQVRDYARLKEQKSRYEELEGKARTLKSELLSYAASMGVTLTNEVSAQFNYFQTEAAKYKIAIETAEAVKWRIEQFEARTDMETLMSEKTLSYSLEEINERIHALDDELEEVRSSIEQYNRQMEDLQEQLDLRDEKKQEYEECTKNQEKDIRTYDIVTTTQELLQKARESFTARYMAPITQAFCKYYEMILGPQTDNWMIDANIHFHKKEQGELRDTKNMSAGYQDLIGVCMRLALVEAMFTEEKPFLIMDDPFVNLDEEKTENGMQLLYNVAQEYQTIYFTCHSSREPVVEVS